MLKLQHDSTHTSVVFVDTKEPGIRLKNSCARRVCEFCLLPPFPCPPSANPLDVCCGCRNCLPPLLQQLAQDGLRSCPVCRLQPFLGAGSWLSASDSRATSAVGSVQRQQQPRGLRCVSWRGQKAPKTKEGN